MVDKVNVTVETNDGQKVIYQIRRGDCLEEAPFEISTPSKGTHRPTCTSKGHRFGHSIILEDGFTIISWGEPNAKKSDAGT